jgi:hypothetical protein
MDLSVIMSRGKQRSRESTKVMVGVDKLVIYSTSKGRHRDVQLAECRERVKHSGTGGCWLAIASALWLRELRPLSNQCHNPRPTWKLNVDNEPCSGFIVVVHTWVDSHKSFPLTSGNRSRTPEVPGEQKPNYGGPGRRIITWMSSSHSREALKTSYRHYDFLLINSSVCIPKESERYT